MIRPRRAETADRKEAKMRKFLTTAVAATTLAGAIAVTATPVEARDYGPPRHYYRHHDHRGNDAGVAVAAGIVGLALGAALANSGDGRDAYYDRGYYRSGYYEPRGYYSYEPPRYRTCVRRERTYDPYYGRSTEITRRYPC
jgi:hypothetical protein